VIELASPAQRPHPGHTAAVPRAPVGSS